MSVTQKDLARELGVSQALVSLVLRGDPAARVNPETRRRVRETALRRGYRVNAPALALRTQQSRQIAYVFPQWETVAPSPLDAELLTTQALYLSARHYHLLVQAAATEAEALARVEQLLASGQVDGCIWRRPGSESMREALKATGRPVVMIGQCDDPGITSVGHDVPGIFRLAFGATGRAAAPQQAERRPVGLLVARREGPFRSEVRRAWETLAPTFGCDPSRFAAFGVDHENVGSLVQEWLAAPEPPAALLGMVLSDRTVVALGQAVAARGAQVGKDINLVLFGEGGNRWLFPRSSWLLAANQAEIGRQVAERLLSLLAGQPPAGPVRLLPELQQL